MEVGLNGLINTARYDMYGNGFVMKCTWGHEQILQLLRIPLSSFIPVHQIAPLEKVRFI